MSAEKATILVADDEAPLRELLRKILAVTEYQLLMAADGREALSIAEQHEGSIDLLLSDIVMPQMSGLELARVIAVRHPETRIILTSANTRYIWAMKRNWHFMAKPYDPVLLLDTVREALNTPSRASRLELRGHFVREEQ